MLHDREDDGGQEVHGQHDFPDEREVAARPVFLVSPLPLAAFDPDSRDALFAHLRTMLPTPFHEALDELNAICEERRQLALQKRMHHWLHGWLLVHAPLSMALLLLAAVHAIISIRY